MEQAVRRADARAIHEMLDESSQKRVSESDVAAMLARDQTELVARYDTLSARNTKVHAIARLNYADGESASLELEQGTFRVSSAGALPSAPPSPEQALGELRRVLARRSYAGLLRLLSPATRASIEQDLRTLVEGLAHPESLEVKSEGDGAMVTVPGGHHVRLRNVQGTWRVDDFD